MTVKIERYRWQEGIKAPSILELLRMGLEHKIEDTLHTAHWSKDIPSHHAKFNIAFATFCSAQKLRHLIIQSSTITWGDASAKSAYKEALIWILWLRFPSDFQRSPSRIFRKRKGTRDTRMGT